MAKLSFVTMSVFLLIFASFTFAEAVLDPFFDSKAGLRLTTWDSTPPRVIGVNGERIATTAPLRSEVQTLYEGASLYNDNARVIPGFIRDLIGSENLRVQVKLSNGNDVVASSQMQSGFIKDVQVLGKASGSASDAFSRSAQLQINDKVVSHGASLYLDENVIRKVTSSKNPQKALADQWGKGVKYDGLNFGSGVKAFVINGAVYVLNWFNYYNNIAVPYNMQVCTVERVVVPTECVSSKEEKFSYKYQLSSDYAGICNEMTGKGPGGFDAVTNCAFSYRFCVTYESRVNEAACSCDCFATSRDASVSLSTSQDLPSWNPAAHNASANQVNAWNNFMRSLRTHEDKHTQICRDSKDSIQNTLRAPVTKKESDRDCTVACRKAKEALDLDLDNKFRDGLADENEKQEKFDRDSNHGANEGVTLDCSIK